MVETAARQPSLALPMLMSLITESRQFDRRTRSKTVSALISSMASNDVETYVTHLMDIFHTVDIAKMRATMERQAVARKQFEEKNVETTNKEKIAKEKAAAVGGSKAKKPVEADDDDNVDSSDAAVSQRVDAERAWALEQLAIVLRSQRSAACATPTPLWVTSILELFFFHSYFPSFSSSNHTPLSVPSLSNTTSGPVKGAEAAPAKLVDMCRARLATALDFLLPMRLPKLNTKSAAAAAAASSTATTTPSTGSKKRKEPSNGDESSSTTTSESRDDEDFPAPWAMYHIHDYWHALTSAGHKLVTPLSSEASSVNKSFVDTLATIRAKVAKKSDKLAKKKSVKADRAEVSVKKEELERYRALETLSMYLSFLSITDADVAAPLEVTLQ
jgi:hypothetical protein